MGKFSSSTLWKEKNKKVLPSKRKEGKTTQAFSFHWDVRQPDRSSYKPFKVRWNTKSKDDTKASRFNKNAKPNKVAKKPTYATGPGKVEIGDTISDAWALETVSQGYALKFI